MPASVSRTRVASFERGDLQALPFLDAAFDVALSGLVLNFVPDQPRAVRELARVVLPGGAVAVYIWDYAGEMQFMRYFWDAAAALDPGAPDEGSRFLICRPEPLKALFAGAGLQDVDVRPVDIPTVFRDFDDFWSPFLGGQGAAPRYAMALPEATRAALRERLHARPAPHGRRRFHLPCRTRLGRARCGASRARLVYGRCPVAYNTPCLCPP